MSEIEIGIVGAGGRMGRMLVEAVSASPGCRLVSASEHPDSEHIGRDAGEVAGIATTGVPIQKNAMMTFDSSQVVIDFTLPKATLSHLELARKSGTPMVIGTTGFNNADLEKISAVAERMPIVMAPNYSIGVNLMFKVAAEVADVIGRDFDIEIIEAHHRHKVDAPSGTALGLGKAIADAVHRNLGEVAIYGREGVTGTRNRRTIGFSTIRGGDIVGDHTALFAGEGERLEITHKASSRMTFAKGAVRAAQWVLGRGPGLFDMQDILGFRQKTSSMKPNIVY
ncbi:MAG: 4-hydroxy-tetrahydrodipicolinate reductase [Magnetococcales bacterium]|nr:4-hydroxy-tetrahydrodipicolinate reductase [Magnetococcales bacterium]